MEAQLLMVQTGPKVAPAQLADHIATEKHLASAHDPVIDAKGFDLERPTLDQYAPIRGLVGRLT